MTPYVRYPHRSRIIWRALFELAAVSVGTVSVLALAAYLILWVLYGR